MSRHHLQPGVWGAQAVRLRDLTLARYGTICALCHLDGADTSDHVVPLSRGGHPTDLANRQPAHGDCNRRRGNKTMAEWWASNPLPTRPTLAPSRDW